MTRDDFAAALGNENVRAFLRLLREGESSQDESAYTIMFGGGHFEAPPWEHPRKVNSFGGLRSSAAGAYQFLTKTWDALVVQHGFEDFSPTSQDQAAVALIAGRKALQDVVSGRLDAAISKCCREWASLPDPATGKSYYGQGGLSLTKCRAIFEAWGGKMADEIKKEERKMSPLILPALQIAAKFIPQLMDKFGSGSEVSNRNIAAGKVIADAIVEATASPNIQAAVDKMSEDPETVKTARAAVAQVYPEIFEVGGGLDAARRAAADTEGDWRKVFISLPFVVIVMLIPMVYFVVYHVVTGAGWSQEIRASVVSAVISGVLFAIVGYALGTSYGSQRKTTLLGGKDK